MGTKNGDSITVYYNPSYPSWGDVYRIDWSVLGAIIMISPWWIGLIIFTKVKQTEYIKRKKMASNKDEV